VITIPIGPLSFSRDFLDGQGHVDFDLPAGLKADAPFAPTVTDVFSTGGSMNKADLTFGDPNGLAIGASVGGGGAVKIELVWPGSASPFAKAYELAVPAGRVGARFHLDGRAAGSLSGAVPLPSGIGRFSFGLKVGSAVAYDRYCEYDATTTSLALLQDLLTKPGLPQRCGTPATVPHPGEILVFGYDGFLDLTSAVTAGYELIRHESVTLQDLDTALEYGLRLKASAKVGYRIAGQFEIAARPGSGPTWVRLVVKKHRAAQFDFAAAFEADAIAAVTGLPSSADEFLAGVFGADVRRVLEVFQKIRADSDLDTLQADVDHLLIGSVNRLANKWLGRALDRLNVQEFQAAAGKVVDEYAAGNTDRLTAAVHLYEDYVDRQDTATLVAALEKIVALPSRDALATLDDADAWQIVERLGGGDAATLVADDESFAELQAVARTGLDFAQGGVQPQLKDIVDELKARLRIGGLLDQLTRYTTRDGLLGLTDTALQAVIERLLRAPWAQIKASDLGKAAAELRAALDRINDFKDTWYKKLDDALHRQFSVTVNDAFTRSAPEDALVDVEIDVATPQGQRLFQLAAYGQFGRLFDRPNLRLLRIRRGTLTHALKDSAHLQIHVLDWSEARVADVLSQTSNSIEVQATGLVNVFTTQASAKARVSRDGYRLESDFLMKFAGTASATPRRRADRDYLIRTLRRMSVSYRLAMSDRLTSPRQLTQYLDLAEYLQLVPSGEAYAAVLATEFPDGIDAVSATYVAKYDATALLAAFAAMSNAPLEDLVRGASRRLVSAHLISASTPQSDLVTIGFAYRDPAIAAEYAQDGPAAFPNGNSTTTIPGWWTGGPPRDVALSSGSIVRRQLTTLYGVENELADALRRLDRAIDAARRQHAAVGEDDLERAARAFVETAPDINAYGTVHTFFGIFDAFVQRASGTRPASTLVLDLTPRGGTTPVTKYLMRR
jgi:hypothetical protein